MSHEPDLPLDRPQVTVVDPRTGATVRADVVGDDREPRRAPRWVAPVVAGALLGVVAVPPAATWVRDERRADRAAAVLAEQRAAERALDDVLALLVTTPRVYTQGPGRVHVGVGLLSTAGRGVEVVRVEVVGPLVDAAEQEQGERESFGDGGVPVEVTLGSAPVEVGVTARVDCRRVADALRTGGPALEMAVVVHAVPRSGRQQVTDPVAVPATAVRDVLTGACELDRPTTPGTARYAVVGDRLVLTLTAGPRDVPVVGHLAYGLTLRSTRPVPYVVPRGRTVRTEVEVVRLADCANPDVGGIVVRYAAADGDVHELEAQVDGDEAALQELAARIRRATC